jgi:hypothetical protein
MRSRYIYHHGEIVYAEEGGEVKVNNINDDSEDAGYYVMPDIQPYQSMADGTMITSRSEHREHLKKHGLQEIGNETKYLKPGKDLRKAGQKQAIIESLQRAKEKHGTRAVERAITDSLHRAYEMERNRR